MEIVRTNQVTPHRLHALIRLVLRLKNPTRKELLDLLQPPELISSQDTVQEVYRVARHHNLILEHPGKDKRIGLHEEVGSGESIASVNGFRTCMRLKLLCVVDDDKDNYLLNLFTAWYVVQDERVIQRNKKDMIARFCTELFPQEKADEQSQGRIFNEYNYNAWLSWVTFLGFGWAMRLGPADVLVPDAYDRLKPLLPDLLSKKEKWVPFRVFAERLAKICPELDSGKLFEKCWQASRGAETRGNQLSLMLSTGLRTSHKLGQIELTRQADASDMWQLYPAEGHPTNQVTHIRLKG